MAGPLRVPNLTPATDGSDTFEALNWKVFAPGYWKGELFSPVRVANIVSNYRAQKSANPDFAPRAKLGHDRHQRLATSLGLPNAGRVTDLRPTDDGGFEIDVRGIPRTALLSEPDPSDDDPHRVKTTAFDLHKAFADGQYDSGSVELTPKVRHPERPTEWLEDVFDGVAFLGEENPAVKATARPKATTASGTNRPFANLRPSPAPRSNDYSSGRVRVLCFSDYSEVPPVDPNAIPAATTADTDSTPLTAEQKAALIAQIAAAMGLTPDDPTLTTMTDDQLRDMAAKVGSQQFSDHMKKTYSATPAVPATAADQSTFMAECKKMFSEEIGKAVAPLAKRLEATEAAVTDVKKSGDDAKTSTLMSEAERVVTECISTGRLLPRLKAQTLGDLKKLAVDTKTFSDGADKGLTAFQAELKALKNRQPDMMFSEGPVIPTPNATDADDLDDFDRRAMNADPRGKLVMHHQKAHAGAK